MDISKIPADILDDLRERGHTDTSLTLMSADEAFDEFCEWHGLINWGPRLRYVMGALAVASKAKKP
jgi:hypothetical protein